MRRREKTRAYAKKGLITARFCAIVTTKHNSATRSDMPKNRLKILWLVTAVPVRIRQRAPRKSPKLRCSFAGGFARCLRQAKTLPCLQLIRANAPGEAQAASSGAAGFRLRRSAQSILLQGLVPPRVSLADLPLCRRDFWFIGIGSPIWAVHERIAVPKYCREPRHRHRHL